MVIEDDDPMPQFNKDGVKIVEGVNSTVPVVSPNKGTAPATNTLNKVNLGKDTMADLVGDPDFKSDDDGDGDTGTGVGIDGVKAGAGVLATGGLQVVKGGTLSNDNDKDPNKSLPVHLDEDAMIDREAETEAAVNTKSNTTVTKSIAMLNATIMASVWSLSDQIPCNTVTASVEHSSGGRPNPTSHLLILRKHLLESRQYDECCPLLPYLTHRPSQSLRSLNLFQLLPRRRSHGLKALLLVTFSPFFLLYQKHHLKCLDLHGLLKVTSSLHLLQ